MRLKKITAAASAIAASLAFATAASAYLAVPPEQTDFLSAVTDSWRLSISSGYEVDYTRLETIRAVVEVTDGEAYQTDKKNGFYSDGETAFTDFTGALAFNGTEWLQFNITGLSDTDAGTGTAEVRTLGDGQYLLTGYLPEGTEPSPLLSTISLLEWGNHSPDYSLRILSFGLYADGLEPIIVFGADGNQIDPPEIVIPDSLPEETTAEAETEPEETEAEPEETEAEPEETEAEPEETEAAAPAETTAAETQAQANETEQTEAAAAAPAAPSNAAPARAETPDSFASRDSGLMIVLIAAGVLIAAAIVGIVVVSLKKRK